MLVTGTSSGILHVWNLCDKNHEIVRSQTHRFVPRCDEKITLLDVSDDLGLIVAGTEMGNVRLYRARPRPFICIRHIVKETSRRHVRSVIIMFERLFFSFTYSEYSLVSLITSLIRVTRNITTKIFHLQHSEHQQVRSVRFVNMLGQLLVLLDNELRLVDLTHGKTLAVTSSLGRDVCPDLLISSDARFVVVSSDHSIRVLWLHSLEEQRRLESALPSPATRMACSSDQRCIFVHLKNGHVYAYSIHLGIGGEVPYSRIDQKQEEIKSDEVSGDDLLSDIFMDHDDDVVKSTSADEENNGVGDLDGLFGDGTTFSSSSSSSSTSTTTKAPLQKSSDNVGSNNSSINDSDFLRDLFSGY